MEIYIVDAFSDKPYGGNPAAVCLLEAEQSSQWMQNVALEMNLSETAFVRRTGKDFSLRWFTPLAEVALCGHATLATAHVLWHEQFLLDKRLNFHTKSGVLSAEKKDQYIELNFPLEQQVKCEAPEALIKGLGMDFCYVGKNSFDYLVELVNEEAVKSLQPRYEFLKELDARGVLVTSGSKEEGVDFVSRCFFPLIGVPEDPVTGSAHCCLGPYWQEKLGKDKLFARQLSKRGGSLKLHVLQDRILIQGEAVTTLRGKLLV